MEARILKSTQAEYVRFNLSDATDPGIEPFGTEVLVLMDQCSDRSTGGVHLPSERIEAMNLGSESGVVVDMGEGAFAFNTDGSRWTGRKPSIGDRVFTERYAGRAVLGRDGLQYRIMTHTCIAGRETPAKEAKQATSKPETAHGASINRRVKPAASGARRRARRAA